MVILVIPRRLDTLRMLIGNDSILVRPTQDMRNRGPRGHRIWGAATRRDNQLPRRVRPGLACGSQ